MSNSTKLRLLGALAVVLVVVGIVLVVTGDDEPTGPSTTTTTVADGQAPTATLPLDDTSVEGVSSLVVPDGAKDFLTAATENKAQLDVTFTLPSDQVDAFVSGSGFPALAEGEKVVTHSSPLWKLNPEGTESGAADSVTVDGVTVVRAVETVPEGDRVRVRLVLTPGS